MSQIKLDNLPGFASVETVLADVGRFHVSSAGTESFDDHLQRAQAPAERTADGGPDSTIPESNRPPARDTRPEADDRAADAQDPGECASEEKTANRVSGGDAAENDPAQGNETPTDANHREASETVEADSRTLEEQQTDHDEPKADEDKPVVHHGELSGDLGLETDDAPVKDKAGDKGGLPRAAAKQEMENIPEKQPTVRTEPTPGNEPVTKENPATGLHAEAPERTVVESIRANVERTAAASPNRSEPQAERAEQPVERRLPPGVEASRPGAPQRSPRRNAQKNTIPDRVVGAVAEQATRDVPTNGGATTARVNTETISSKLSDSTADQKASAADDTAKPPENQSNAPVRVSLNDASRADSPRQTPGAAEPGQVDRVRFVQRVARAFQAMDHRHGSVRLRLSPPELGSLRLEISVRNGAMTARIEAETSTARNLLLDNLPALRDRLAQQDIKIEQFHVDLTGRSPGGLPHQTDNHAEYHGQGESNGALQGTAEPEADTEIAGNRGAANRPGEGTQLNVVI